MIKTLSVFMLMGCMSAHARPPAAPTTTVTVEINLGWTWVPARWARGVYRRGHWHHPTHGIHHRPYRHGPPIHLKPLPRDNAVWVPGHWEGRGHRRHWVPGHWVYRPRK